MMSLGSRKVLSSNRDSFERAKDLTNKAMLRSAI